MEDANPYRRAQFSYPEPSSAVQQNPITRGKSYMNFLCKALLFAMLIIILPLFPSHAPEFINESVITKFWELLYLLFIGIAVSYGLFSRRNVETDTERHPRIDNLQSDMSRMFHVSSLFEDGYENPYGSDEKRASQSWNGHYFLAEPRTFWPKGSIVIDEQCKPNLSFSENGVADSSAYDERNLIQDWNSQPFQGESMVVVAQPNLAVGEWGESRSGVDYKPLGLPVRSLKSRTKKQECPRFINGNESGSDSQGSSTSSVTSRNGQFGDLGPQNLEHKFHEAISSPSPIPWRSRSRMREMREQVGHVTRPHSSPLSVDEAQFESTRTQFSRSTASFSSQASSLSSSPKKSISSDSISSEELNSKMEDAGKEEISEGSSSSLSPSPPKPVDDKVTSSSLPSRRFSFSSLDEKDPQPPKTIHDKVRSSSLHSRRYSYSSLDEKDPPPPKPMNGNVSSSSLRRQGYSYSSLDEKDPPPPKSMNGKVSSSSLHTRGYSYSSLDDKDPSPPKPMNDKVSSSALHSRGYSCSSLDEKDPSPPKPLNDKVSLSVLHSLDEKDLRGSKLCSKDLGGGRGEEMKSASFSKASPSRGKSVRTIRNRRMNDYEKMRGNQIGDQKVENTCNNVETGYMRKKNGGIDKPGNGSSKQNLDNPIPCNMPKPAFSKNGKKEMEKFSGNISVESEEDLGSRAENVQVSSDEDAVLNAVNNEVADSDEVDKKAGEFIAKFREQIRLQKTESMERSRGLHLSNCFR